MESRRIVYGDEHGMEERETVRGTEGEETELDCRPKLPVSTIRAAPIPQNFHKRWVGRACSTEPGSPWPTSRETGTDCMAILIGLETWNSEPWNRGRSTVSGRASALLSSCGGDRRGKSSRVGVCGSAVTEADSRIHAYIGHVGLTFLRPRIR
jgi:hypothetical protein